VEWQSHRSIAIVTDTRDRARCACARCDIAHGQGQGDLARAKDSWETYGLEIMLHIRFYALYQRDAVLGFFVTKVRLEGFARAAEKHLTTVVVVKAQLEVLCITVSIRQ